MDILLKSSQSPLTNNKSLNNCFLQVRILADANKHLKLHAAESLAKLAKYKKGRNIVRKNTGIQGARGNEIKSFYLNNSFKFTRLPQIYNIKITYFLKKILLPSVFF